MREWVKRWLFRRSLLLAVLLILLAGMIGFFLLPYAVSSETVRDRLERDISEWAGHSVSLGNAPRLGFWPVPTIQLDHVVMMPRVRSGGDPIMRAESIMADFNLFSAVLGTPTFSDLRLIRPTFNLEVYPDGSSNWGAGNGELVRGIEAAVALDTAQRGSEPAGDPITIPASAALGTVTIVDGTVNWIRDPGAPAERLSALNGTLSWSEPRGVGRTEFSAIFRGEQVRVSAQASRPLLLLGGRRSSVQISVQSAPLNLSFSGDISSAPDGFANGELALKSPSVRRALEWSGTEIKPGEAIGALELEADLSAGDRRAKLNDLILLVDRNRGIGVLDIAFAKNAPPAISGTLAFNSLDVASFLGAFTPLPQSGADIASTIDTRFLRELGLDLRLSAQSARFGAIALSNLAAAARVDEGRATFDIGDAQAYGGNVIGRLGLSEQGIDGGGMLQLSARNVDFGELYDAIGLKGPMPRGRGNLNLDVNTPFPTWATATTDLAGKFSLSLQNGTVPGFNLAKFRQLSADERFFRLSEADTGTPFSFRSARFSAEIVGGQIEISEAQLEGEDRLIRLNGVIPYMRGGLAMAGSIALPSEQGDGAGEAASPQAPDENADDATLRFFVGGSWPQPVISPVTQAD